MLVLIRGLPQALGSTVCSCLACHSPSAVPAARPICNARRREPRPAPQCAPSPQAAAALYLARKGRGAVPFWPSVLRTLTGYHEDLHPEVRSCWWLPMGTANPWLQEGVGPLPHPVALTSPSARAPCPAVFGRAARAAEHVAVWPHRQPGRVFLTPCQCPGCTQLLLGRRQGQLVALDRLARPAAGCTTIQHPQLFGPARAKGPMAPLLAPP